MTENYSEKELELNPYSAEIDFRRQIPMSKVDLRTVEVE